MGEHVLWHLNLARCEPRHFASLIQSRIATGFCSASSLVRIRSSHEYVETVEGLQAVLEAIQTLRSISPRKPLESMIELQQASHDHVNDIMQVLQQKTTVSHIGSDGSTPGDRIRQYCNWSGSIGENIALNERDPFEIVAQFIVNDGVPDRSHRTNVMAPLFRYTGIAASPCCCVVTFAENATSKELAKFTQ